MSGEARDRRAEEVAEAVDHYTAVTVPVRVEIDVEQVVVRFEEAERILRAADSIALGPCACRRERQNCDRPVDTCITLDRGGDEAVRSWEGFRSVSVEEGLAALRTSHEAGLVHLAYRKPGEEPTLFCSCCSCCCWFLSALKRFDYHDAVVESSHVAEQDVERCAGCGVCVERCPFEAWSPAEAGGKPYLDATKCFGCGVCVSGCPAGAIAFVPRS